MNKDHFLLKVGYKMDLELLFKKNICYTGFVYFITLSYFIFSLLLKLFLHLPKPFLHYCKMLYVYDTLNVIKLINIRQKIKGDKALR